MRFARLIILLLLFLPAIPAHAQGTTQSSQTSVEPNVTEYSLPADVLAKSRALETTWNLVVLGSPIWSIVVLCFLVGLKVGPRYRDWAESLSRRRYVQVLVVATMLFLTVGLLDIPLRIYWQHVKLGYGLSVQNWGSWFWDWTKGELLIFAGAWLVAWLLYALVRRWPRQAWFYFWLAAQPILVFVIFIAPVVIDPMFNKFVPLSKAHPQLVEEIGRETKRAGMEIPPERMFEMEASEKVTTYNAYVTGFGSTKRVVVWDNTARDLTTGETLFIFGHEMGHYVLNHIVKGILFAAALTFVLFYLGYQILAAMVERWGDRWQIHEIGDLASMPLILLIVSVLSFVSMPATSGFSRHIEHQADVYGLEVIHGLVPESSKAAAASFQKLGEKDLDYPYPNPVVVFWMYDHPDIASRLRFAVQYRPWDVGQALQYVK